MRLWCFCCRFTDFFYWQILWRAFWFNFFNPKSFFMRTYRSKIYSVSAYSQWRHKTLVTLLSGNSSTSVFFNFNEIVKMFLFFFRCSTHFCYLCGSKLPLENPYSHFSLMGTGCFNQVLAFGTWEHCHSCHFGLLSLGNRLQAWPDLKLGFWSPLVQPNWLVKKITYT